MILSFDKLGGWFAFVSHASADAARAQWLCSALEKLGVQCWIAPRDILPGSNYAESILAAIENANAFVLMLSENANTSTQVANEVERAANKGKTIFPCRIEPVPLGRRFELFVSTSQWLDFYGTDEPEKMIKSLAIGILEALGQASGKTKVSQEHAPLISSAEELDAMPSLNLLPLSFRPMITGTGTLTAVVDQDTKNSYLLKEISIADTLFPIVRFSEVVQQSSRIACPEGQWLRDGVTYCELLPLLRGWPLSDVIRLNHCIFGTVLTTWTGMLLEIVRDLQACAPSLIHRDIKPSNIMVLEEDLALVLVDFTTCVPNSAAKNCPRVGTEGYIAPEVSQSGYSLNTDLYAVGCTLFATNQCRQPPAVLARSRMGMSMELTYADHNVYHIFEMLVDLDPAGRPGDGAKALSRWRSFVPISKFGPPHIEVLVLPNGEKIEMED